MERNKQNDMIKKEWIIIIELSEIIVKISLCILILIQYIFILILPLP